MRAHEVPEGGLVDVVGGKTPQEVCPPSCHVGELHPHLPHLPPWTRVAPLWSALKRFGPRDGPDPSLVKLSSPGVKTLPTLSARPPPSSSLMFMPMEARNASVAA